jgi:hypothetical protein
MNNQFINKAVVFAKKAALRAGMKLVDLTESLLEPTTEAEMEELQLHELGQLRTLHRARGEKVRYVVSLIKGYTEEEDEVHSPTGAVAALLETLQKEAAPVIWCVYDRKSKRTHYLPQSFFQKGGLMQEFDLEHREAEKKEFDATRKAMAFLLDEIVGMFKITWGEFDQKFADVLTPIEELTQEPATLAQLKLYRNARAMYDFLRDLDGAVDSVMEEHFEKIKRVKRDLAKLEEDPQDWSDPLAALEDDLTKLSDGDLRKALKERAPLTPEENEKIAEEVDDELAEMVSRVLKGTQDGEPGPKS